MSRFTEYDRAHFKKLVDDFNWTRKITTVHVHHTWRPNHSQWKGVASMQGMWNYHTKTNGWSDLAQHITIAPDGKIWSGRNWNAAPASAAGYNSNSRSGPFMFETVGDFDKERDKLVGEQLETVLFVTGYLLYKFSLPLSAIKFHNQMTNKKTCPGSSINYKAFQQQVEQYSKKQEWGNVPSKNTPVASGWSFPWFGSKS